MTVPAQPKIYHIVHVDRLRSILADEHLWCDAEVVRRAPAGTAIGMAHIKQRRLNELTLTSHPGLYVGDCVPFYFCPRSIMLYLIHRKNPELSYSRRARADSPSASRPLDLRELGRAEQQAMGLYPVERRSVLF